MNLNRDQLLADLMDPNGGEGFRPYPYDDKTGKQVFAPVGRVTLAYGWCLDTALCTEALGKVILEYWVDETNKDILRAAPWVDFLPEAACRAVCNMAFNLGISGLLAFKDFLGLLQRGDYAEAAADLETTLWFKQVGHRAVRIQALVKSCAMEGATA